MYEYTVIFHTGPGSDYYAGFAMTLMPNVSWLTTLNILSINSWSTCTHFVYFKLKKELNYDRFVDLNKRGAAAARLVHSDPRIY